MDTIIIINTLLNLTTSKQDYIFRYIFFFQKHLLIIKISFHFYLNVVYLL